MKARHLIYACILSLLAAGLSACSDAIFATIETETKTVTNTLSTTISVFDVALVPPILPASSTFYVAAGRVFQGQLVGSSVGWTPNSSTSDKPFNPPGLICNSLVYYPASLSLWGAFSDPGSTPLLFQSQPLAATLPYTFNGASAVTIPAIAGKQVGSLRVANNHLFVGALPSTGAYEIDYFDNTLGWSATPLISGSPYPYSGVAWDGAAYWTAANFGTLQNPVTTIYKSVDPPAAGSFLPLASTPSNIAIDIVNDIFADPANGFFFVATRTHGIYFTPDHGTTWIQIPADQQGNVVVSCLCVAGPIAPNTYLAGSDGYGYYILSVSPTSGSMTRYPDSTKVLYLASVSRIAVDGSGNVLMGTNSRGLWRSTTADILSTQSNWINE